MQLIVEARPGESNGIAYGFGYHWNCQLGRSGIVTCKHEGDGGTPIGCFPFRKLFYRSDRRSAPKCPALTPTPIRKQDGWCDDPSHPAYNLPVLLPFAARSESLWREDRLYDLVLVVGYNDDPPFPGRGSAIFVHLTHEERKTTEGCISFHPPDLLTLLEQIKFDSRLLIRFCD